MLRWLRNKAMAALMERSGRHARHQCSHWLMILCGRDVRRVWRTHNGFFGYADDGRESGRRIDLSASPSGRPECVVSPKIWLTDIISRELGGYLAQSAR